MCKSGRWESMVWGNLDVSLCRKWRDLFWNVGLCVEDGFGDVVVWERGCVKVGVCVWKCGSRLKTYEVDVWVQRTRPFKNFSLRSRYTSQLLECRFNDCRSTFYPWVCVLGRCSILPTDITLGFTMSSSYSKRVTKDFPLFTLDEDGVRKTRCVGIY